MYRVKRSDGTVRILEANSEYQGRSTGEAESEGDLVYEAKDTDFIIINGSPKTVGAVLDEDLLRALHQKGKLR